VKPVEINPAEVIKFIMSAGVSGFGDQEENNQ